MSAGSALARWLGKREPAGAAPLAEPGQDVPLPALRRERSLGGGDVILREVLAEKVLHGWMQNRYQVLFPLTVNLRTMQPGRAALLTAMMAAAGLAGGGAIEGLRERGRVFLRSAGGDAAVIAAFEQALAEPPALSTVVAGLLQAGMGAYAYVAALVVLEARDPVGERFLDYLVLRLGLPTAVVRSANRRYGR